MPEQTAWADLTPERQLALREAYGRDPDCLTETCALDAKTAHFSAWLAERGVRFSAADLRRV